MGFSLKKSEKSKKCNLLDDSNHLMPKSWPVTGYSEN